MMALLVAPAMATVTISVVDNGDCTADIVVVADGDDVNGNGDSLVAGIALDVSVSAGQIDSVTGFKDNGESVDGDEGYGIYLGTMTFTGGDPEAILDVGTPVAPAGAPDNPPQLPGPACVLELGCLFDVSVPEDAPLGTTILCRINLSETATVTLAENATRGGVVLIGGDAPSSVVLVNAEVNCECYTGPDYAEWVIVGKPSSWCADYQCHGDSTNSTEVIGRYTRIVGYRDVDVLLLGFDEAYSGDPALDGTDDGSEPDEWISADFNHIPETIGRYSRRVGYRDMDVLLHYFDNANGAPPGDCQTATPVVP